MRPELVFLQLRRFVPTRDVFVGSQQVPRLPVRDILGIGEVDQMLRLRTGHVPTFWPSAGLRELRGGYICGHIRRDVVVDVPGVRAGAVHRHRSELVHELCGRLFLGEGWIERLLALRRGDVLFLDGPIGGDGVPRGKLLLGRVDCDGVRCRNVLPFNGPIGGDGMPRRELLHGRIKRDGHLLRWLVLYRVCARLHDLPRGELLLWRIKRDGHLRRGQVLRYLGGRLHELRHGHLPGDRRLRVLCELRVWDVLHCDGPSRGVGVSGREPVRGRRRGPGLVPVGVVLRELFERVFELRGRHVPGFGGCGGVLGVPGWVLLRLDWPHGRERRVRSWGLLCNVGKQLHELLGQHVLGRGGLCRLFGLRERAVLGRRLGVVHGVLPRWPVLGADELRGLPCRKVLERAGCIVGVVVLELPGGDVRDRGVDVVHELRRGQLPAELELELVHAVPRGLVLRGDGSDRGERAVLGGPVLLLGGDGLQRLRERHVPGCRGPGRVLGVLERQVQRVVAIELGVLELRRGLLPAEHGRVELRELPRG